MSITPEAEAPKKIDDITPPEDPTFLPNFDGARAFVATIDAVMQRATKVDMFYAGKHYEQGSPLPVNIRYAYWTQDTEPKGTVILLGGRTEYIEKHAETIERFLDAGYDVWSMDWRGQGRSTRLLPDRNKGYVRSMQDFADDFIVFANRIVQWRGAKKFVVVHSMGGHAVERALISPGWDVSLDGVVLSGAMMRINLPLSRGLSNVLSASADRVGLDHFYGPGQGDPDLDAERFETNSVTFDERRFWGPWLYEAMYPDLLLGGVTWGFLAAALGSSEEMFAPRVPESIPIKHLLLLGSDETVVLPAAIHEWAMRLPKAQLVEYPEARHELLHERDPVYNKVITDVLEFFRTA
ncbi:MAG: alpha/beta hydrolase [Alphaproteobacteria bacterium]|nr:alpha/beta hydrolase [Alphaproteobacteria bacterium]